MKKYLPLFTLQVVLVIVFGTIYTVAQQSLRMGANDPQIQLAEDTAAALDGGATPSSVLNGSVNMQSSLAPFVIVYDKSGNVVDGNGYLNGRIPVVPLGVLTAAKNTDYNFVTWQPQSNVRVASVSVAANKYYVLSGRSLKEVEGRQQQMLQLSLLGLLGSWAVACVWALIMRKKRA